MYRNLNAFWSLSASVQHAGNVAARKQGPGDIAHLTIVVAVDIRLLLDSLTSGRFRSVAEKRVTQRLSTCVLCLQCMSDVFVPTRITEAEIRS